MRIALLIPVFNAEKYLRECLDSALAAGAEAERSGHSLEIRCRDDGSKDASAAILEEYADRYPNVTFSVQANAGVSATRNRLLDELPDGVDAFAFSDLKTSHAKICELIRSACMRSLTEDEVGRRLQTAARIYRREVGRNKFKDYGGEK